jgi:hypothetical protein
VKNPAIGDINISSGVTREGKPFSHIAIRLDNGLEAHGQLSPDELRMMALGWISAAEAAEQDALILQALRETGLDDGAIGGFINRMRELRELREANA